MYDSDLINEAMKKKRITNERLAKKTGLSYATISYARNGRAGIKLETLEKITRVLGIPFQQLFIKKAA